MALTDTEVQRLIRLSKKFADTTEVTVPPSGAFEHSSELVAVEEREAFLLDVSRHAIRITRCKSQTRYARNIILLRVELDGPPHVNPDGTDVGPSHVHVYKEGYDDRWAYPLSNYPEFLQCSTLVDLVRSFCRYCGVVSVIPYQEGVI